MIIRALAVGPLTTHHSRRRSGFTLVELLVSMALIMMIMAVLSASFIVGLDTFAKLKALGDMSERLRAAVTQLRSDLDSDHFDGRNRVSDPFKVERPREGFFRVKQFQASTYEGQSDGIPSYRAAGQPGHVLHMTVKKRGNRPEDFFSASLPGTSLVTEPAPFTTTFFGQLMDARQQDPSKGLYRCQWAEVCYYLQPLKTKGGILMKAGGTSGTPLYSLHRLIRLAVVNNKPINAQNTPNNKVNRSNYGAVSFRADPTKAFLVFNSPSDMAATANRDIDQAVDPDRFGTLIADPATMLLTDVASFDIKLVLAPQIPEPPPAAGQQLKGRFGYPLGEPIVAAAGAPGPFQDILDYDSATWNGALMIQITLRIWDQRTQQTRQITMIQDL